MMLEVKCREKATALDSASLGFPAVEFWTGQGFRHVSLSSSANRMAIVKH